MAVATAGAPVMGDVWVAPSTVTRRADGMQARERVGDRRVERLTGAPREDRDRGDDPGEAVGIESGEARVRERAVAFTPEEDPGAIGETIPRRIACHGAQERLGGGRRPGVRVGTRRVRGESPEPRERLGVRDGAVRWLVGDDGGDPVRRPGSGFEGEDAAEAHPDERGALNAAGVEVRDEVVDVDLHVERAGLRKTARAGPAAVDRVHGEAARADECRREPVELGRGGQRPVQEEDVARSAAGHAPADGVAARPCELARAVAGEERTDDVAPELAAGGPREGVEPRERGRHLEARERGAGVRSKRTVARVAGAGLQHDRRHRDMAPRLVRPGDDRGLGDRGVGLEHRLDLRGRDVLPAPDDAVGAAVHDDEPTRVVEASEIARLDWHACVADGLIEVPGAP